MTVISAANDSLEFLKYVKGANIVIRNINILKEQSLNIEQMYKTNQPLGELRPLVHTVVWSTKRLNMQIIEEFNKLIAQYFDPKIKETAETSPEVDLEIKKNFAALMANPQETQDYLEKFCDRNKFDKMILMKLWPDNSMTQPIHGTADEFDLSKLDLHAKSQNTGSQNSMSQNAGINARVADLRRI